MQVRSRVIHIAVALGLGMSIVGHQQPVSAQIPQPQFEESRSIPSVASQHVGTALGDLNGDGIPDLVVLNFESDTVSVRMNTTGERFGQPTFGPSVEFPTGKNPRGVAIGELNNDGRLDIAVANRTSQSVTLLINATPKGAAQAQFNGQDFPVQNEPRSVAIGDLNKDTRPDVVVANGASNTVSMLLNQGTGTNVAFDPAVHFAVGNEPTTVVIADLNDDDWPDIATANFSGGSISVLMNNRRFSGFGFLEKQDISAGSQTRSLAVGDLNGDDKPDIVAVNQDSGNLWVFENGIAAQSPEPPFFSMSAVFGMVDVTAIGGQPLSVTMGDFNGDGKRDVAVALAAEDSVAVLAGSGSFNDKFTSRKLNVRVGNDPYNVTAADLNRDGIDDLVTGNRGGKDVSVALSRVPSAAPTALRPANALGLSFSPGSDPTSVQNPWDVVLGDLNGDGVNDIVASSGATADIAVHLNFTLNPGGPPIFERPGDTGPQPWWRIQAPGRAGKLALGDLDGDGDIDVAVAIPDARTVSIWYNTTPQWNSDRPQWSDPTFALDNYDVGIQADSIAIGDFSGDGRPEVVVADRANKSTVILLNDTAGQGTRKFMPSGGSLGETPLSLMTGDFNIDGKIDLAILTPTGLTILFNRGGPGQISFEPGSMGFQLQDAQNALATLGDINGDGQPDMVVAANGRLTLLANRIPRGGADMKSIGVTSSDLPSDARSLAMDDFDGDGLGDLAIVFSTTDELRTYQALNVSLTTGLAPEFRSFPAARGNSLAIGEVNFDTKKDICIAATGLDRIKCLINTTPIN